MALGINAEEHDAVTDGVAKLRQLLRNEPMPGLQAHVTGPAGVATDLNDIADDAGRTLLLVPVGLVLVLLLAIYRSPLLALRSLHCSVPGAWSSSPALPIVGGKTGIAAAVGPRRCILLRDSGGDPGFPLYVSWSEQASP